MNPSLINIFCFLVKLGVSELETAADLNEDDEDDEDDEEDEEENEEVEEEPQVHFILVNLSGLVTSFLTKNGLKGLLFYFLSLF